jgi:hypothetical protein
MVEAAGVELFQSTENTEVIEKARLLKVQLLHNWAKVCTSGVRASDSPIEAI